MPELTNIRYNKNGDYGNKIFIASYLKDRESYNKLENFYNQLKSRHPDNFLPIFCNTKEKYATIRFKTNKNFDSGDVYNIAFTIKKKIDGDRTYINCFLDKSHLVKRAELIDHGEILNLE